MVGHVQLSVREEEQSLVERWGGEGAGHEGQGHVAFGTVVPNDSAEQSSWLLVAIAAGAAA